MSVREFDTRGTMSVMKCIVSPQSSCVEASIPNVTIFGDSTFKEALKIKWGHKGGSLMWACPLKGEEEMPGMQAHRKTAVWEGTGL